MILLQTEHCEKNNKYLITTTERGNWLYQRIELIFNVENGTNFSKFPVLFGISVFDKNQFLVVTLLQ